LNEILLLARICRNWIQETNDGLHSDAEYRIDDTRSYLIVLYGHKEDSAFTIHTQQMSPCAAVVTRNAFDIRLDRSLRFTAA
jgi:hypothetical protein